MAAVYYRLMATDGCPTFEPVSHYMGTWSGVAAVVGEAEIARLDARQCRRITAAEYEEAVKKKAQLQPGFQPFRLVSPEDVQRAAQKPATEPTQPPPPVTVAEVTEPRPVPVRRGGKRNIVSG